MVGGPCDFSVSPSPSLDFGSLDFGLGLDNNVLKKKEPCFKTSLRFRSGGLSFPWEFDLLYVFSWVVSKFSNTLAMFETLTPLSIGLPDEFLLKQHKYYSQKMIVDIENIYCLIPHYDIP